MSNQKPEPPLDLGMFRKRDMPARGTAPPELIAVILSAIWIIGVAAFFLVTGVGGFGQLDSLRFVVTMLAIFLPVAMIWIAAMAAKSTRVMREESARLQAAIDAIRQTYLQQQISGAKPSVEKRLEDIAVAQRKTESALATFTSIRHPPPRDQTVRPAVPPTAASLDEQGQLALGTPAEALAAPVNVPDFIRALNFPENAEDKEGFRALRRALHDRQTAQLVQASQDVLTLLSQDGIYMDDLSHDRARPEVWRKFARGERGRATAALGGVRDRSSLALAAGRMRQDPIFRDAVHHFLRRFDQTLARFETTASDADLADLSSTRTARAFMLLGRVTGTFD